MTESSSGYGDLALDAAELRRYRTLAEMDGRRLLLDRYIEKETGYACSVGRGQIIRIACCDGPQVCDFNAFSADDPSEHFWSGRTRTLQGAHLTVGDRLWSTEPKMRPMFTIIADTVPRPALPMNAAPHDLIYARCSASAWALRLGHRNAPNCNDNLVSALTAIGFPTTHVHDAFNIFMTTGIDERQKLFFVEPTAREGDYVELHAEIDAVVALSCCPGGCNGAQNKGLQVTVWERPPDCFAKTT
jgi:uncharacterized protein YcgI (DUF1989 family)